MPSSPEHRIKHCPQLRTGLALLLEALECAEELQTDPWDFAVELRSLLEGGCTRSTVRWLLCRGYAQQAQERIKPRTGRRSFRRLAGLALAEEACLVLTETGRVVARSVSVPASAVPSPLLPCWDGNLRELRFGEVLVKQFTQPAINQETILAAFQEEGWPSRIDNPLPPRRDQDAVERLHDAVLRLNRHQQHRLLHFRRAANGQGIRWEVVRGVSPERPLERL